jgi:large subunit ribosomal protein L23
MKYLTPHNIILAPLVTEKSLASQEKSSYTFLVDPAANKNQIGAAFESVFGIKPKKVRTVNRSGKVKTNWKNRLPINKADKKIAIITLKKDQKIDILSIKTDKK